MSFSGGCTRSAAMQHFTGSENLSLTYLGNVELEILLAYEGTLRSQPNMLCSHLSYDIPNSSILQLQERARQRLATSTQRNIQTKVASKAGVKLEITIDHKTSCRNANVTIRRNSKFPRILVLLSTSLISLSALYPLYKS